MRFGFVLLVLSLIAVSATAQTYDLELGNTNVPSLIFEKSNVPVSGTITNNGPESYITPSGVISMDVHARYTPLGPSDTFDVFPVTTFEVALDTLEAGESFNYVNSFYADASNFATGHSGITIIIWPRVIPNHVPGDQFIRNHYFVKQVSTTDSVTAGLSTSIDAGLSEGFPVTVYPNPTTDRLTVQFETNSPGEIRLTGLGGKQFFMTQVNAGLVDQEIQTESLGMSPGIYFVSFKAENGPSWTRKVMVVNE